MAHTDMCYLFVPSLRRSCINFNFVNCEYLPRCRPHAQFNSTSSPGNTFAFWFNYFWNSFISKASLTTKLKGKPPGKHCWWIWISNLTEIEINSEIVFRQKVTFEHVSGHCRRSDGDAKQTNDRQQEQANQSAWKPLGKHYHSWWHCDETSSRQSPPKPIQHNPIDNRAMNDDPFVCNLFVENFHFLVVIRRHLSLRFSMWLMIWHFEDDFGSIWICGEHHHHGRWKMI